VSFRVGLDVLEKKIILLLTGLETRTVQPRRLVAIGYFRTGNKTKSNEINLNVDLVTGSTLDWTELKCQVT